MSTPLLKRVRLVDDSAEARADRGVMARSQMLLFAVAGLLALAGLAAGEADVARLAATAAVSGVAALALLGVYEALPTVALAVLAAVGALLADWNAAGPAPHAVCAVLLASWAGYSLYYFPKPIAALEALVALGGYALAATLHGGVPLAAAAATGAALVTAAALAGIERAHVNRLVGRLADVARRDPLTGLLNRRGFEDLIETELERSRRSGQPLSLIAGDLDHFKSLNDRFGHAAGDSALERLALILGTAKRRIDTVARIGGEEFAVVLPDSDQHAALILAERMRREVREAFAADPHALTISLGVATFPVHAATVDALLARADEALYAAKALGRDRTEVFSDGLDTSVERATGEPPVRDDRHTATVLALADVLDGRESGRVAHAQTVGRYAGAIARELGFPESIVERVRFGGIVHDVGKVGVPDSVLSKPGWLDAEDWIELRRHPEIGARILSGSRIEDVGEWVRAHHERPDGSGYPDGLAGTEIPLEARILAVADAFEAMTSDRVYRAALSPEEAREELVRCVGTQFDRRVVDAFLRVLDRRAERSDLRLAT